MMPVLAMLWWAPAGEVAETVWVWRDGPAEGCSIAPWRQASEVRRDGAGAYLQMNADWAAEPWAGCNFQKDGGDLLVLDEGWLAAGFVRFLVTGGYDRYGGPNAELIWQVRPLRDGVDFERVNPEFIERGRGLDEDPGTWQEVLVPLGYWQGLRPGDTVRGISLQCVERPTRAYGVREVGFVRFVAPPDRGGRRDEPVSQPHVRWPEYAELPPSLRALERVPRVSGGAFCTADGRRVFLINPYCREDNRLDLWGSLDPARRPPPHGTFDPGVHGWIYDELLTGESLARLGFNSYSATMPSEPFWRAVGYPEPDHGTEAHRLPEIAARIGLPFFVDAVCWPWTLGQPAAQPGRTHLPAAAFTAGSHHWVPYRLIGPGREAWLALWRVYAERYRDAGAEVIAFELFNEPAYREVSDEHRAEFEAWLRRRYPSLEALRDTWRVDFATWPEAAAVGADARSEPAGRFFDYDEYLAERFADLVAEGVRTVNAALPGALVGVQPMGGWALEPREAIWKHRLVDLESVVLTPTGGGRWTPGGGAARPPADPLAGPMAPAPLEDDLLLALAGDKMLVDNETYLSGQTAREVRNRLWQQVVAGLDGLTVFSWSKRGWSWWGDESAVRTEADRFPYSSLIPYARRTDALRGIHDFAREVQPLAETILPKPWGPAPTAGVLYSWPHARRRAFEPGLPDKTPLYHAALRYGHWNLTVVPSHQPARIAALSVLVAGGIRHLEPELLGELEAWVRAGGLLIVGEEPLALDLYGRPIDTAGLLGGTVGEPRPGDGAGLSLPDSARLPGAIGPPPGRRELSPAAGTRIVLTDGAGRAVAMARDHGRGTVVSLGCDLGGYRLLAVLEALVRATGRELPLAADVRLAGGGLAPNVLLSRRSYDDRHALLLMNLDGYAKSLRLTLPGIPGRWRAVEALSGVVLAESVAPATEPVALDVPAGEPAVVVLEPAGDEPA